MTNDEKAKAYNEALERARKLRKDVNQTGMTTLLEEVFPELRESEDERIRKEAISIVQSYMNICDKEGDPCLSGYKVISWLEKQKESKHAPDDLQKSFEAGQTSIVDNPEQYGLCKKQEWSEEEEKIRKLLIWQVYRNIEDETNDLAQSVYDGIKGHDPDLEESIEDWKKCLAWLKSLRPSWKPSEELLEALHTAAYLPEMEFYGGLKDKLRELYEQLRKL